MLTMDDRGSLITGKWREGSALLLLGLLLYSARETMSWPRGVVFALTAAGILISMFLRKAGARPRKSLRQRAVENGAPAFFGFFLMLLAMKFLEISPLDSGLIFILLVTAVEVVEPLRTRGLCRGMSATYCSQLVLGAIALAMYFLAK